MKKVNMKKEMLTLVDTAGDIVGEGLREACHTGKGWLHLAYLILIFNRNGELLVQKRSRFKTLWPGYWDGSTASHVLAGENIERSMKRELMEEVGVSCSLQRAFSFLYFAHYGKNGVERELCHIYTGYYDGEVTPHPAEVSEWKWVPLEALRREIARHPQKHTPWLRIAIEKLAASGSARSV